MAQLLHTAQAGTTRSATPAVAGPQPDFGRQTGLAFTRVITGLVLTWQQRRRDRQTLARLDAHMLRDIGLEMRDACIEAEKPFWRA